MMRVPYTSSENSLHKKKLARKIRKKLHVYRKKLYLPVELECKYVLVKGDDARSGAKENPCHGWL